MTNIKRLFLSDRFILGLIILNALVIFIEEFANVPSYVNYLDNAFTIAFVIELVIKIREFGFRKYWKSNWNRLDFMVVSIAILAGVLEITNLDHPVSLEFITTLRVLRLFKSFRLIKFVPNIGSIIAGVNSALRASYVVILAFCILLFIVSVLTCSLFKGIAPEYFDTPALSLYSVFRVFSIEGWYEIPDLIAERSGEGIAFFARLYFVLLLFFGGILGMSLINSIFVDAMVSDNNDALEEQVKSLNDKIETLTEEIREIKNGKDKEE